MKRTIVNLIVTAALLLAVGCTTTLEGKRVIDEQKAEAVAPALTAAVSSAVIYAHSKDTNSVRYILVVRSTLEQFVLSNDLNPAKLQFALYQLPVAELKTTGAQLVITPILAAYKVFYERQFHEGIESNYGLKVLVRAMIDGIIAGHDAIGIISGT